MKIELLNKIKTGDVYVRKTGERCLVQSIETVSDKNNNVDYIIHFLLQPTNVNSTRKTELIEDFINNISLADENDHSN
jgi:hypothetical protein